MRVVRVADPGVDEPAVQLVDGNGQVVEDVSAFLRVLTVRRFSPNTVRAYAHDLQKLMLFLDERGLTLQDFTPARAVDFLATLRHKPSNRRAQRLDLAATVDGGRLLSARTCNRILAAVSSFYEFLITCERYTGRANPIQKQADPGARRAVARWRPPLLNSSKQVPVRRTPRVKTVEALPRPISDETYRALISVMRTKRDRALRCALLIARWSGARRAEIRKLHLDCLDTYPDGTHRIRLASGKSRKERIVPIHPEAAAAIEEVVAIRRRQVDRALFDPELVRPVRRLFLHNGRLASPDYLFTFPLRRVCTEVGLLGDDGKAAVHAHRFRHTLGTELAGKGAKTLTIMKILGHASAGMSLTYAHISDPVVLADYKAVLEPGAILAGPQADIIRTGRLDQESLDWVKTNF
jgi:integrase/recombinase XerD